MIITPLPVDLEQGSSDWIGWRSEGIGSSDVASILGISPWETVDELWSRKLGLMPPRERTAAMQKGIDHEPEARFLLEWKLSKTFPPQCFTTLEYPWMKVSLDGWNRPEIAEFKCPGKTSHAKYLKKGPPEMYVAQMQYQMAISGGETTWFVSYNEDFPEEQQFLVVPVARDEAYIEKMMQKVMAFMGCLVRGIEPTEGMLTQSVEGLFDLVF